MPDSEEFIVWRTARPRELLYNGKVVPLPDNWVLVKSGDAAVFLAFSGSTTCGFAQCGLRQDYVEGTHSNPVGYLEGIYVKPEYRKSGCAKLLLAACESWAREQGCAEFASDCELTNEDSLRFHLNVGFREANRIICFTKNL
jgi:aminoglycoside 6'-N-acetyltransferase I